MMCVKRRRQKVSHVLLQLMVWYPDKTEQMARTGVGM